MSHFKERKEKNCLNCNAIVAGKYCQVCGQENIVPKESFWHLITHFFNDITHFEGKFFTTTKLLLLKPGFLPREYLRGKRASYLHPIRMYVFTSAIFFLIFFSITGGQEIVRSGNGAKKMANEKKMDAIDSLIADTKDSSILVMLQNQKRKYAVENDAIDSISRVAEEAEDNKNKSKNKKIKPSEKNSAADSALEVLKDSSERESGSGFGLSYSYPDTVHSVDQYEKYQAGLPKGERDGWFIRTLLKKQISLDNKYRYDANGFIMVLKEKFIHSLPQMLFISLPLFALVLQLLYIRRKQFYYTDHGVFSIYHFIAVFIIMLFLLGLEKLWNATGWTVFKYMSIGCLLYILFYLYKSMRNFYQQRRGKTIIKFILLCMVAGTLTAILTLGLLLITFLKV
ncbi:MAG: DUF3667 domain-containing protein [Bacteroidota bacterium]